MMESRVTDINRSMPVGADAIAAARRQVPHTSEPAIQNAQATPSDAAFQTAQPSVVRIQQPIDVKEAVEKLNSYVQAQRKDVHFSVDEESKATVIKFFKSDTGELIKQFPPEEILAMIASVRKQIGWLYDGKV